MKARKKGLLLLIAFVLLLIAAWATWQWYAAPKAPTVITFLPQETIGRDEPIVLVFDQPMDHASVEAALRIIPPVKGVFRWETEGDGERLIFTPAEPLPADTTVRITLGTDAMSRRGVPLARAFEAELRTPATLAVVTVAPAPGSEDVPLETPIIAQFDRDVIQFTSFEDQSDIANPFRITPEVRGFVRWVAPNLLGFYPEEGLQPGTTYTVRLIPQIAQGVELDEPLEWTFTTKGVGVAATIPFNGAVEVDLNTKISVIFSVPPDDPDTVAQAFSVREAESGRSVSGKVAWETETRLVFTPDTPLAPETTYEIALEPSGVAARSLATYSATFTTLSTLHVESVVPEPGTVDVPTDPAEMFIAVKFNHPVVPLVGIAEQAELPVPFTIEPPLSGTGEWVSTSYFVFSPDEPLRLAQTYTVTVLAGLTDTIGTSLPEAFTWSFITEGPHVVQVLPEDELIGTTSPITVVFSHPMDPQSVAEHTRVVLDATGAPVPLDFTWAADDTVVLTPQTPYPHDENVTIIVEAGARAQGGAQLSKPFKADRHVAPVPRLLNSREEGVLEAYQPLRLSFNVPMDMNRLRDAITLTPDPGNFWLDMDYRLGQSSRRWDYRLMPHGGWEAGQTYTITIGTAATSRFGNLLEEPVSFSFRVKDLPPLVELIGADYQFAMFSTVTDTMQIVRVRNVERVKVNVYALTENQFFTLLQKPKAPGVPFSTDQEPLATWTLDTSQATPNEAHLFKTRVPPDGKLEPGLYVLDVEGINALEDGSSKEVSSDWRFVIVSPYNVLLKTGSLDSLVWVSNLADGAPAPGMHVRLYAVRDKLTRLGEGETDTNGLAHITFASPHDGWETVWALVQDDDGRIVGLTSSDWYEGAEPWLFNIRQDFWLPAVRGTIYTDRPIYRPGQRVYFRGVLWRDEDAIYTPLKREKVLLTIWDPQREVLEEHEIELSPFGTFFGEFDLNEDASLGSYTIEVEWRKQQIWATFGVVEYRLPEFEVSVTPSAPEVKQGDPLSATIQATYFFGGAVSKGRVNWRMYQTPYFFDGGLPGYWSWHDSDDERDWYYAFFESRQDLLASGSGELDMQGLYRLDVPTTFPETTQAVRLNIEADVSDASNQVVSGRSSVIVHPGDFYIGLRARTFVGEADKPITFDVRTLTPDREPFGNAELEITLARREWYSVQVEDENGATYWTTRFTDTVESVERIRTDEEGAAELTLTPSFGGVYTVLAVGRDAQGREIRSRAFVWVASGNYVGWRTENNRRIDLVADKREYAPGDTARILVPTPYTGMKALVTVERATIRRAWVVDLPGNSSTIEVPLDVTDAPNVYVSVTALKSAADGHLPDIRLGYINLPVALTGQTLNVEIVPAPEPPFEPRQTVTFTIRATTHDGEPVPNVEFSVALVDKALLSLAEDPNPDLMEAFYAERPLSIRTGGSLFINVDIVSRDLAPEAKGGGGGGGGMALPMNVRENFRETAFWQADLRTDQRGEARFSVTLPDNLTTWVLTARGVTDDGRVAQGTYEVLTTRIFFVRPVAPRFFVVGDEALLKAIVHNNTSEPLTTTITFSADNLVVDGKTAYEVVIPPRGAQTVAFPVRVPQGEATRMVFHAVAPGYEDAVALTTPIFHRTTPSVVATAGQVRTGQVVERFVLPPDTDPTQGGLTVEIAPSLAGLTQSALDYLETYPYACSEQIVSSFLPNIMTYRALDQAGLMRADLEPALRNNINLAVQRLVHTQNSDGGWGWWRSEASRPWLTAYALLGLHHAKEAGFSVPTRTLEDAEAYLTEVLDRTSNNERSNVLDMRAFILYVLAERGRVDTGRLVKLYEKRDVLGNDGLAFLTMALTQAGEEQAERVQTLVTMLTGRALLSATGAHWEESSPDPLAMDSSERTTALVLDALVRARPNHMLIPETVRWLMGARRARAWESTQTTAWAVMALTDYMVASGELQADFSYRLSLNGEVLLDEHVSRENVLEPRRLERAIGELLLDEANELVIARTDDGPGRLYYAAWVEYFSNIEDVPPLERGIAVSRRYELADPLTFESTGMEVSPDNLRVGDVVMVRLTVIAPQTLYYFILEDPLPAGFEAIDPSLLTTSQLAEGPRGRRLDSRSRFWYGDWTRSEIRDEKVALFKTILRRGTYEYTYLARVTLAGTFTALPAVAYEMYHPEVFGRSASVHVAIRE